MIHAGVSRRVKTADGHSDYTINVSGIPVSSSEDYIRRAVATADLALDIVREEIEKRISGRLLDQSLRSPSPAPSANLNLSVFDETPAQRIPDASEIYIGRPVFGVDVSDPRQEWEWEKLNTENSDGSQGGQLLALNAGFTAFGFKGPLRHRASVEILKAYGNIGRNTSRISCRSLKDLTKAEAHIVLTFLAQADAKAIELLKTAIDNP
jgi:hypothetical protein